jgi:hypothetical protein
MTLLLSTSLRTVGQPASVPQAVPEADAHLVIRRCPFAFHNLPSRVPHDVIGGFDAGRATAVGCAMGLESIMSRHEHRGHIFRSEHDELPCHSPTDAHCRWDDSKMQDWSDLVGLPFLSN